MGRLVLALGVLAVATSALLVRWADPAAPLLFAAARTTLAAVLLASLAGRGLAALRGLSRRQRGLVVVAGVLLAAHFASWISSLRYTSTAASLALIATQPIFAGLIARVALGDPMTRRELAGVALAAVGCLVLAGGDLGGADRRALFGDGLAMLGAALAAGYLTVGRSLGAALPILPYMAAVNAIAGLVLIAAALATGVRADGLAPHVWVAFGLAALVPSVLGHTLLNVAVRTVPVHLVSLAILGEPLIASSLAWAIFGERPSLHTALGGAVILVGIVVGFVRLRVPPVD